MTTQMAAIFGKHDIDSQESKDEKHYEQTVTFGETKCEGKCEEKHEEKLVLECKEKEIVIELGKYYAQSMFKIAEHLKMDCKSLFSTVDDAFVKRLEASVKDIRCIHWRNFIVYRELIRQSRVYESVYRECLRKSGVRDNVVKAVGITAAIGTETAAIVAAAKLTKDSSTTTKLVGAGAVFVLGYAGLIGALKLKSGYFSEKNSLSRARRMADKCLTEMAIGSIGVYSESIPYILSHIMVNDRGDDFTTVKKFFQKNHDFEHWVTGYDYEYNDAPKNGEFFHTDVDGHYQQIQYANLNIYNPWRCLWR